MISPKHLTGPTTAGPAAEVIVDVRGLVKNYSHKMAVKNVSFSIRRAEIFGVLGPNGAGKTTTVEISEGIRKPDSDTVLVAGLDVWSQKNTKPRIMGVQPPATTPFPELTLPEKPQ